MSDRVNVHIVYGEGGDWERYLQQALQLVTARSGGPEIWASELKRALEGIANAPSTYEALNDAGQLIEALTFVASAATYFAEALYGKLGENLTAADVLHKVERMIETMQRAPRDSSGRPILGEE